MFDPMSWLRSWKPRLRNRSVLWIAILLILPLTSYAQKEQLYLVKDGRAVSTIVVPRDTSEMVRTASRWVQEYIKKASGAELTIETETGAGSGTLISVGHTKLAKDAGITLDGLKYDGCKLVVKGDVLYLVGRDYGEKIDVPDYSRARGTCRAVVTFLEDYCGVHWFLPGPMGTVVPRRRHISISRDVARSVVPAFGNVTGRETYGKGTAASFANNFTVGLEGSSSDHSYYHMLPSGVTDREHLKAIYGESRYFADHPEYFALIDGKRTGVGNHLCSTNPRVREILLNAVREKFDQGLPVVSLGQEDGYRRCQCDACEKLDNYRGWGPNANELQIGRDEGDKDAWESFYTRLRENPGERVLLLHKWITDECRKSHPDKMVNLLLYGPTMYPSKKFEKFGDNVLGTICSEDPRVVEAWQGKIKLSCLYSNLFCITVGMGMDVHATPRQVAETVRTVRDQGFIGFRQYAETNWGLQGPSFYELGKLLANPDLDYQTLVEEYCRGVYGKGADSMLAFFDLLNQRHDRYPLNPGNFGKIPKGKDGKWLTMSEKCLDLYPSEVLGELERLIKKAEGEAESERSKGWLRLTRDHFDYLKLVTNAVRSYRRWQATQTIANWIDLEARVREFDAYRMRIITYPKSYTDLWFPGHSHFCNYLTSDGQNEQKIYWASWEKRKPDVLRKGVTGIGIGFTAGTHNANILEPFTLDFSKSMQRE